MILETYNSTQKVSLNVNLTQTSLKSTAAMENFLNKLFFSMLKFPYITLHCAILYPFLHVIYWMVKNLWIRNNYPMFMVHEVNECKYMEMCWLLIVLIYLLHHIQKHTFSFWSKPEAEINRINFWLFEMVEW